MTVLRGWQITVTFVEDSQICTLEFRCNNFLKQDAPPPKNTRSKQIVNEPSLGMRGIKRRDESWIQTTYLKAHSRRYLQSIHCTLEQSKFLSPK
ncbi:hypothetical protein TNIN_297121 [Trichonephila inaurata madagascariensis]|uniref:Uncharacterized protein n=1 Tax=Trichonephila inaurata madagascariensis TaxID=2747483 RepID=A0A8X7C6P3_9ARAC|nr:hypothetical protein TNIN_297121 [Trichonephila inaurata madagascariensis]